MQTTKTCSPSPKHPLPPAVGFRDFGEDPVSEHEYEFWQGLVEKCQMLEEKKKDPWTQEVHHV